MLVADLANDLFHHVLHRHQARCISILIHDDGYMIAVLLHLTKQIVDRLGLRNEANGANQVAHAVMHALRVVQFEHIPDVDKPENLIDCVLVYRDP